VCSSDLCANLRPEESRGQEDVKEWGFQRPEGAGNLLCGTKQKTGRPSGGKARSGERLLEGS